ncbi:hypothetical protein [Amycolatopsis sp. CA-230715]|uniref:hypothetical protein n=1 Tax=Amycolatopsis sp. CA-230715 TaxID=2745196 RepID=UPI001C0093C9|nr:hypothetical protein [Amycolatopsis sp. CA-230715]
MPGAGGTRQVERLLDEAGGLSLRAPELAMVLGEHAAALAETSGSEALWIRAESVVVSSRVGLGKRASTVARAVAALRAAEEAGHPVLAARLRADLAVCARSVGLPLTGLTVLRPVLAERELAAPHRAAALCHLVGVLAGVGRKAELDRTLLEADRLCVADESLTGDERLLVRGLLRVATSSHRRRHADLTGAADAARTGIGFLDQVSDERADGGVVRIRLVLQLVCTLLDRGDAELALEIAQPLLDAPIRAAAVAPAGWLRLAIATRVLMPSGAGEAAAFLLRDAVHSTSEHDLHALTARLWLELAHVEEQVGSASDAIDCLHRARAAEHVHSRVRRQACAVLANEFGSSGAATVDLDEVLAVTQDQPRPSAAREPALAAQVVRMPVAAEPVVEEPVTTEPVQRLAVAPLPVESAPIEAREPEPAPEPVREPVREKLPEIPWERAMMPDERPEVRARAEERAAEQAAAKTRHDSEHGSVAAKSVLDRLGISAGGGGGRRRATADEAAEGSERAERSRAEEPLAPEPAVENGNRSHFTNGTAKTGGDAGAGSEKPDEPSFDDNWLPRLQFPPSLEPTRSPEPDWESSSKENGFGGFSEPFQGYSSVPEEEVPADAGLADLLARALAEHQAGTSSAAALVKRLGAGQADGASLNGHGRTPEGPDSGRHRNEG